MQQSAPDQSQTSSAPRRDTRPRLARKLDKRPNAGVHASSPHLLKAPQTPGVIPHRTMRLSCKPPSIGSLAATPEPREAAQPNLPLAAQEAHFTRAGAAEDFRQFGDPVAPDGQRSILRCDTNSRSRGIGECVGARFRPGSARVASVQSGRTVEPIERPGLEGGRKSNRPRWQRIPTSQQESHANGQRGSQQQQSSGGDRQPQRDRRANGGQWQQELDQQITGGDAHPGGNGQCRYSAHPP